MALAHQPVEYKYRFYLNPSLLVYFNTSSHISSPNPNSSLKSSFPIVEQGKCCGTAFCRSFQCNLDGNHNGFCQKVALLQALTIRKDLPRTNRLSIIRRDVASVIQTGTSPIRMQYVEGGCWSFYRCFHEKSIHLLIS